MSGTPPVTGPAGGNTKEVCAAAKKASAESVTTFIGELGKMRSNASTCSVPADPRP